MSDDRRPTTNAELDRIIKDNEAFVRELARVTEVYDGCACGGEGRCCPDPSPERGHHLFCDCESDYCDFHWHARCANCGTGCYCDV